MFGPFGPRPPAEPAPFRNEARQFGSSGGERLGHCSQTAFQHAIRVAALQHSSFKAFVPPRGARAGLQPGKAETEHRRQDDKDGRHKSESERRSRRASEKEGHVFHPARIDRFGRRPEQNRNIQFVRLRFMVTQCKPTARYYSKTLARISCVDRHPSLATHDGRPSNFCWGRAGHQTMLSELSHADRRRFHQIDDQCISTLRQNKDFLIRELDAALDRLYSYLRSFMANFPLDPHKKAAPISKEKHLKHWALLLEGRLDQEYMTSVASMYTLRSSQGFDRAVYIGGYNFLVNDMIAAIGARFRRLSFSRSRQKIALQTAFLRIATYNMAYVIEAYFEDNYADRAAAMDELARSFEDVVGGVVGTVSLAAAQLRVTADDLTHSAESTNLQSMAAADASKEASTNVQAVADATNHLSQSIGEISDRVQQSNRIAGKAAGEADRTHAEVQSLAKAAERIGGIIGLISNIAGQTNMLALNATIEAARAGEAGRGFAIVAQEVKSLADATAKATADIGAQVAGIQAATHNVAAFIATIAKTTQEVSSIAVSVERAVAEQEAVTQEIVRRMLEASQKTTEVSTNIVGVTEAAGDSSQAARRLLDSATGLTQQSEVLSKQVEDFLARVRAA